MAATVCWHCRCPRTRRCERRLRAQNAAENSWFVMNDDQAAAEVAKMPNVKELWAKQGTTFTTRSMFPLCCP